MTEFFIEYKAVFIIIHAFFAAIGLGAVIVTDTLFFSFLKDLKISQTENKTLDTVSQLIWVIIVLLVLSGLCLYLAAPAEYSLKAKFITKMIIFGIIALNGLLLNAWLAPNLKKIVFGGTGVAQLSRKLKIVRKLAFASGAVSMTSWVIVFLLGSLRAIPLSATWALLIYVGLCLLAIVGSQMYAYYCEVAKN